MCEPLELSPAGCLVRARCQCQCCIPSPAWDAGAVSRLLRNDHEIQTQRHPSRGLWCKSIIGRKETHLSPNISFTKNVFPDIQTLLLAAGLAHSTLWVFTGCTEGWGGDQGQPRAFFRLLAVSFPRMGTGVPHKLYSLCARTSSQL